MKNFRRSTLVKLLLLIALGFNILTWHEISSAENCVGVSVGVESPLVITEDPGACPFEADDSEVILENFDEIPKSNSINVIAKTICLSYDSPRELFRPPNLI